MQEINGRKKKKSLSNVVVSGKEPADEMEEAGSAVNISDVPDHRTAYEKKWDEQVFSLFIRVCACVYTHDANTHDFQHISSRVNARGARTSAVADNAATSSASS
jgi:hypothetical protein